MVRLQYPLRDPNEDAYQVVRGNGGSAPLFAPLYESCVVVPPHLALGQKIETETTRSRARRARHDALPSALSCIEQSSVYR